MRYEIRKLSIIGCGKTFTIIGLILGLLTAFITFWYLSFLISQFTNPQVQAAYSAQNINELQIQEAITNLKSMQTRALIILPIVFIILSFIFGVLFALIYNLMVRVWGGIKLNVEEKEVKIRESDGFKNQKILDSDRKSDQDFRHKKTKLST